MKVWPVKNNAVVALARSQNDEKVGSWRLSFKHMQLFTGKLGPDIILYHSRELRTDSCGIPSRSIVCIEWR
jgi:hypothetical protein